ncbi:T9SS type B sorting domain-containing protein [Pseudochryseolinea flava]|uniref:Cadherin domain-containing protein n=1 Tax=Pseudochryseolinea flava TaxID=2059302 RepID=A0A364XWU6_9BACT|nr:gliding motility-associated C-terminal domain-containing protein [Pseudochryseolinea flava]RAV98750.1 hypothetical protein DQQ10_22295 [Pseudochryseolinea flava]
MRILLILFCLASTSTFAQRNAPVIRGQRPLSTNENQPITITFNDLDVRDRDDWFYPLGFTMTLYAGQHYTFADKTVTPERGFHGKLTVPVTVNDGEHSSDPFNLIIDVVDINTPPAITGQNALSIGMNGSLTVKLADLKVSDPDNTYPTGFTMRLGAGANYTVSGTTVTPSPNYSGALSVPTVVNDGGADSPPFNLRIDVTKSLRITGQKSLASNEGENFSIQLADLVVFDPSNTYPNGFSLNISAGENYQVDNQVITPSPDFSGTLIVNVSVQKGPDASNVYAFQVTINPINDPPQLIDLETTALRHMVGMEAVNISSTVQVTDPDDQQIVLAEVGFTSETYTPDGDLLEFANTESIRGVFDPKEGVLSLIGVASLGQYQDALRSIRYRYNEEIPLEQENRTLYIKLNDGKMVSEIYHREIIMGEEIALDIPNAFTPNGDLANDTWRIQAVKDSERLKTAVVSVYNSRGILVYRAVGITNEWDGNYHGEKLPTDNYYYTIDLGMSSNKNNFKGNVMLLR